MNPRRLSIEIVTPAPMGSLAGNRVTARRWAAILRGLGHRVRLTTAYEDSDADVLVALHARRSHPSIRRFRERHPAGRLVVALTGTDVYRDIHHDAEAAASLTLASLLVLLQEAAVDEIPSVLRGKARVILQSAEPRPRKRKGSSPPRLAVVGHLRAEKDPFRLAEALSLIPDLMLEAVHAGKALTPGMEEAAREWMRRDARYRWKGERPGAQVRQWMADSEALVLTSLMEGGANVISEAVVCGVAVLASRISSSVALLGRDYRGYFDPGDTAGLASLVRRFVEEDSFRRTLRQQVRRLQPMFAPRREQEAWAKVLRELK
ncbi:MAG TPA: selenoneine biosynthesis selenosugar synthase SenB [Thermoanaerobaculia bacterium]|nr:selenoneine biosynthesis selenosugar synthase SenB [Thermoanaerobaculia bacterium]